MDPPNLPVVHVVKMTWAFRVVFKPTYLAWDKSILIMKIWERSGFVWMQVYRWWYIDQFRYWLHRSWRDEAMYLSHFRNKCPQNKQVKVVVFYGLLWFYWWNLFLELFCNFPIIHRFKNLKSLSGALHDIININYTRKLISSKLRQNCRITIR